MNELKAKVEEINEKVLDHPDWRVLEKRRERARIVPRIHPQVLQDRLDEAFGPEGWQTDLTLLPLDGGETLAVCRLTIQGVQKAGVGRGPTPEAAAGEALAAAAGLFGIARVFQAHPGTWVNLGEDGRFQPPANWRPLETKPPTEEAAKLEKAKAVIEKLIDEAKRQGKGREAARLIAKHGDYAKDLKAARALYVALKRLTGASAPASVG